jgi:hypothetical protein
MSGSSNVGFVWYGTNMAVSAATAVGAGAGAAATATANATDPWEIEYHHLPNRKSYALIALELDFSLAPEQGNSTLELSGSFGSILLSLGDQVNQPSTQVNLASGWQVYSDVKLPTIGRHIQAPQNPLSQQDLEDLFLQQHDLNVPLWQWMTPIPMLTFVKEVPNTVASVEIEVGIAVSDEGANEGYKQKQQSAEVLG